MQSATGGPQSRISGAELCEIFELQGGGDGAITTGLHALTEAVAQRTAAIVTATAAPPGPTPTGRVGAGGSGSGVGDGIEEGAATASTAILEHDTGGGGGGRLGPARVQLCRELSSGSVLFRSSDCDVESGANFSSVRANACVHSGGRWMYEVTLASSGIMQLGWATLDCRFTHEEGVGDSAYSYAYDGKRVQKWSVSASSYGERWEAGDVIGVCIDLGAKTVSFSRNGTDLGPAFQGEPHKNDCPAPATDKTDRQTDRQTDAAAAQLTQTPAAAVLDRHRGAHGRGLFPGVLALDGRACLRQLRALAAALPAARCGDRCVLSGGRFG
jgi:hypothetical protein